MPNLNTNFMGIELKNPLIVSSSGLTNSVKKIEKLAENGAAAVILKSIFEEQINHETSLLLKNNDYPEAADYIKAYSKGESVKYYLDLIEDAKKKFDIPIIGSINCVSTKDWTDFAKHLQDAGADAIELNIHIIPTDRNLTSEEQELRYYEILNKMRDVLDIPFGVKIGQHFSNLVRFVDRLIGSGASSVTLFNRFYHPDIDVEKMEITSANVFSEPADIKYALRWIAMLFGNLDRLEISASTGVHDGNGVIKQLLAGAQTVQVCSTVYKNGAEILKTMLQRLETWMSDKGFDNIQEFRGKLSSKNIGNQAVYERAQFMKYFSKME